MPRTRKGAFAHDPLGSHTGLVIAVLDTGQDLLVADRAQRQVLKGLWTAAIDAQAAMTGSPASEARVVSMVHHAERLCREPWFADGALRVGAIEETARWAIGDEGVRSRDAQLVWHDWERLVGQEPHDDPFSGAPVGRDYETWLTEIQRWEGMIEEDPHQDLHNRSVPGIRYDAWMGELHTCEEDWQRAWYVWRTG